MIRMFEAHIEQHAAMLVSYLASMTGDVQLAQDLAQQSFLRAFRRFATYDRAKGSFPTWLRTIARNQAIDHFRKSGRVVAMDPQTLEGLEEVYGGTDRYGAGDTWTERVAALRECLKELTEPLRAACDLFYWHGLPTRAVAERLGAHQTTVLKRLQRARECLAVCIGRKLELANISGDVNA